ncbi:hypothetical protein LINGRAHAP2_LOCUS4337, partial [Linum grandiflorum]
MIDFRFVFTQISTTNLDLHTKELGSARNPPKRLEASYHGDQTSHQEQARKSSQDCYNRRNE